jgi:hypothetical protein
MSDERETLRRLRITGGPSPATTRVELDGQDIGGQLRGLDLHLGVDGPARATFDVVGHGPLEVELLATVSRQPRRVPAWGRLTAAWARLTRRRTTVSVTGLDEARRRMAIATPELQARLQEAIDRAAAKMAAGSGSQDADDLPEPAGAPHPMVDANRKIATALEDCGRLLLWITDDAENKWPAKRYDQAVIARAVRRRHQEAFAIAGALIATRQAEPASIGWELMTKAEGAAAEPSAKVRPVEAPASDIYARIECPFMNCPDPGTCRPSDRCQHAIPPGERPA